MMLIGIVSAVDAATCRCQVQFPDKDGMVSGWLPVVQRKTSRDKSYWLPDPGEQVCCQLDDRAEDGYIAGAIFSDADQPPVASADKFHVRFEDGTAVEYDRASHQLTADVRGDVHITATGELTVAAAGNVTITTPQCTIDGHLVVTGGIAGGGGATVTGDIHATGSIIDGGGNTNHHTH